MGWGLESEGGKTKGKQNIEEVGVRIGRRKEEKTKGKQNIEVRQGLKLEGGKKTKDKQNIEVGWGLESEGGKKRKVNKTSKGRG